MVRMISILGLQWLGFMLACGTSTAASTAADAILEIDGKRFTAEELERKNAAAVFQARNALFDAQRKGADEFIDEYLLTREAREKNVTVEQLLERYAYADLAKDPSDEALRVYYDGIDTAEPYDVVRDKIRDLVRQRRMAKAKAAYIQSLRKRAAIAVRLPTPRAAITVGDAPVRGMAAARVTIIEYADYECPYCQQIQPVVERIEKEYNGKIAFAFKDVPLPMHANAQKAAEAAHCAGAQGKFWQYHDLLFSTRQYGAPHLKEHARALELDQASFDRCLASGAQAERIKAYVAEAQSIGLPGTPGFFINGRFLNGAIDYQVFRQAIEEELAVSDSSRPRTASVRER